MDGSNVIVKKGGGGITSETAPTFHASPAATSSDAILDFMKSQFKCANEDWLKDYYQFANRLSTVSLLNNRGIYIRRFLITK